MGFFSWNCKACKHPILSVPATEEHNRWMSECVCIGEDGILIGEYDGYGRVNDADINTEPEAYHKACWELIGKPSEFSGASEPAADQGWFFDDNIRDTPRGKPRGFCLVF